MTPIAEEHTDAAKEHRASRRLRRTTLNHAQPSAQEHATRE
jgi:hypothetical protein